MKNSINYSFFMLKLIIEGGTFMKKIVIALVTIIALLLIVIGVLIFKPNDKKKYQDKSIFLSSIKEI